MSAEAKAGAFFLLALVLLGYFTFQVEDITRLWEKRYLLQASFDHARELKEGDSVTVSGVHVGNVKKLELVEGRVLVTMDILADVAIYEDAVAQITPSGLLGTKYVNIHMGDPEKPRLEESAMVATKPALDVSIVLEKLDTAIGELVGMFDSDTTDSLEGLVKNLHSISQDLAEGKGTIGRLVRDPEMYEQLSKIVEDFSGTAGDVRDMVAENREDIRAIFENFRDAAPEIKETFAKVGVFVGELSEGEGLLARLIADEELAGAFAETMASLRAFARDLEEGEGLAQRLVNDEELADDLARALAGASAFMQKINEGEGAIHLLLTERELYDDMRRLVDKAEDTLRSMKEQIPIGTFTGLLISAF